MRPAPDKDDKKRIRLRRRGGAVDWTSLLDPKTMGDECFDDYDLANAHKVFSRFDFNDNSFQMRLVVDDSLSRPGFVDILILVKMSRHKLYKVVERVPMSDESFKRMHKVYFRICDEITGSIIKSAFSHWAP